MNIYYRQIYQYMKRKESDPLNMLENIQKVDAPPFLLTRIREQIHELRSDHVSPRMAWGLGISFLLLLTINVFVLASLSKQAGNEKSMVQSMELVQDNTLYHE